MAVAGDEWPTMRHVLVMVAAARLGYAKKVPSQVPMNGPLVPRADVKNAPQEDFLESFNQGSAGRFDRP